MCGIIVIDPAANTLLKRRIFSVASLGLIYVLDIHAGVLRALTSGKVSLPTLFSPMHYETQSHVFKVISF
jgi:hypothetical protein